MGPRFPFVSNPFGAIKLLKLKLKKILRFLLKRFSCPCDTLDNICVPYVYVFHFNTVSTKGCRIREGGALSPSDLFGSEILAKSDFLGSMKDTEIFLGCEKTTVIFLGLMFSIS